jgi:hypothetical protein
LRRIDYSPDTNRSRTDIEPIPTRPTLDSGTRPHPTNEENSMKPRPDSATLRPASARIPGAARAAACAATLALAACASMLPPAIPSQLQPAAGEALAMIVPAKGVQIYECRARSDGATHEWVFVAPEAELFDAHGKTIGTHGAGPHWQSSDGSRVVGKLRQRADAPAPGAIPWLLLGAESTGPQGAFSKVSSIQRVNTAGGVAPADGCSRETAGRSARVGYRADYYFFTAR